MARSYSSREGQVSAVGQTRMQSAESAMRNYEDSESQVIRGAAGWLGMVHYHIKNGDTARAGEVYQKMAKDLREVLNNGTPSSKEQEAILNSMSIAKELVDDKESAKAFAEEKRANEKPPIKVAKGMMYSGPFGSGDPAMDEQTIAGKLLSKAFKQSKERKGGVNTGNAIGDIASSYDAISNVNKIRDSLKKDFEAGNYNGNQGKLFNGVVRDFLDTETARGFIEKYGDGAKEQLQNAISSASNLTLGKSDGVKAVSSIFFPINFNKKDSIGKGHAEAGEIQIVATAAKGPNAVTPGAKLEIRVFKHTKDGPMFSRKQIR